MFFILFLDPYYKTFILACLHKFPIIHSELCLDLQRVCKPVHFLVSEKWFTIYPRILETGLFFWRKRFLNFVNVFSLFCFSIWTNINSHFTKFGWNWPSGFWEEDETVKRLQSDVTDGLTVSRRSEKVN